MLKSNVREMVIICLPREDKSLKQYKEGEESQVGANCRVSLKSGLDLNEFPKALESYRLLANAILCFICVSA